MNNLLAFVKKNWLVVILMIVILYLLFRDSIGIGSFRDEFAGGVNNMGISAPSMKYGGGVYSEGYGESYNQAAPTDQIDRMLVEDTNMSMLVKDVAVTLKEVEKQTVSAGGYMVNRNISKPEGVAYGNISVRVPTEKRETVMDDFRGLGVKVVSENVNGRDVTDQYVDIEGRVASLIKTKTKIETIMDQATEVSDLMSIQTQLTNIERQIDSYKGQQLYLEQTAKLTMVSMTLSTDELALPYAPDNAWRPAVVFKTAVRSLIGSLRSVGSLVIWIVVFAPVWGVLLGAYYLVRKIKSRKSIVTV